MKLPIGISDFKKLREGGYYYVDKTLFIEELTRTNGEVILIPRPRRFGKTLNLSMLHYFFEKSESSNAYLFEDTAIWNRPQYRKYQGMYPVIFLTFKSCKDTSWENGYKRLEGLISQEFKRHMDVLLPTLSPLDFEIYMSIARAEADYTRYTSALLFLSTLLRKHYKKRVLVLIDEYDAPIHSAYTHGYYKEMVAFLRALLTDVFKDNGSLERGILTGILRTAKEGIFSGLNNLSVKTLLDNKFSDKFGFTTEEVDRLLADVRLTKKSGLIKEWYNGYRCGKTTIYNPWSLLECINNEGILEPYWANTSDNDTIRKLIAQADEKVKAELETLLQGIPLIKEIDNGLIFPGIENNQKALWSMLLFAGYVTFTSVRRVEGKALCRLILPNEEIKLLYRELITTIFEQSLGGSRMRYVKESLLEANGELFGEMLQEFTLKSMSMFDIPDSEPERSYHLFVLGLLVSLSDTFEIRSNRESGYGRYDILLIPHDKNRWGIIIEFKKVSPSSGQTMNAAAQKALDQINQKGYAQELMDAGVMQIAAFGVACMGKKTLVKSEVIKE